jgi:hypothetical protein
MDDIPTKWIKPKRASVVYGIGVTKLYDLLNQGFLETKKIGASRLIGVESLDRLFADPEPVRSPAGERKAAKEYPESPLPLTDPRRRGRPRKEDRPRSRVVRAQREPEASARDGAEDRGNPSRPAQSVRNRWRDRAHPEAAR